MADPALRTFIRDFMTWEVMDTLPADMIDLSAYCDALIARFDNPALKHRTWQIAMDGSQKLPQRLLGTIRDRLSQERPATRAALGVAAWMRYVAGIDELGRAINVQDPMAGRLRQVADEAAGSPERLVTGLMGVAEIFGEDLPRNPLLVSWLTEHVVSLYECGARKTVSRLNLRLAR